MTDKQLAAIQNACTWMAVGTLLNGVVIVAFLKSLGQ